MANDSWLDKLFESTKTEAPGDPYGYIRRSIGEQRAAAITSRAETMKGKSQLIQARLAQADAGVRLAKWAWPGLITLFIIFFIMGPGMVAIISILSGMTWWLWALVIIALIIFWRRS